MNINKLKPMSRKRSVSAVAIAIFLGLALASQGPGSVVESSINMYAGLRDQVSLGDDKEAVLNLFQPAQDLLHASQTKTPDKYIEDGVHIEVHYMRSLRQPDGLTTDDEFDPYVFHNDKLVAVGWHTLGGPKSTGEVLQRTNVGVSNTTIVKPPAPTSGRGIIINVP